MIKNFDQKLEAELSIIGKDKSVHPVVKVVKDCSVVHPAGAGRVQKYGRGWISAREYTKKQPNCRICSKPFNYELNMIEHDRNCLFLARRKF